MKKLYAKYKVLVNGLNIIGEYTIDGFSLKIGSLNEDYFKTKLIHDENGMNLNINLYINSCLTDYEKLTYRYFESNDFIEFEVPNKAKIDIDNANELLKNNDAIINKVYDLERKLRLILNIPLLFQIIYIEIFDTNKNYMFYIQANKQISNWNRLTYNLDPKEFHNNSRFKLDFNSLKNTKNNYFDRALEFYNDSFESDKISNRYILIFSCLEAIFNLDTENITEKLGRYSAKILSDNNQEMYNKIYEDIKKLYKKRSDYIHGSKTGNIKDQDEKILRSYTRKIIIAYWIIILYTKKTAKQILKYLDSEEKLDMQVRMVITTLNSNDFSSQQHNLLQLLEKDYNINIPSHIQEKILEECQNKQIT